MPFKSPPDLGSDATALVAIVAKHCRLPHPDVVTACNGPVFPTIRDQRRRGEVDEEAGLLLDDNATPRWALLWAHGFPQTHHPKGWTFAHVWGAPTAPEAYTNLCNLCLLPECLGSLTDKLGPLSPYLKYHAHEVYGWTLKGAPLPVKPDGYEAVAWEYLDRFDDPIGFIHSQMRRLNNQRVIALRALTGC